jgi:hypothetical protein
MDRGATAGEAEPVMPVSEETYERVALEDWRQVGLHCGNLRSKPGMTAQQ